MTSLLKRRQQKDNPNYAHEQRVLALIAELEELVRYGKKEVDNAIKMAQNDAIFGNLEPAKALAQKTAREEIQQFKDTVNQRVDDVLSGVSESKKEIFAKIDAELKKTSAEFSQEVNRVLSDTTKSIEEQLKLADAEKTYNKNEIKKLRTSMKSTLLDLFASFERRLGSMRGPQGIQGTSGKDGKDGSPDNGKQVATKLNTTKESVDMSVIKGLTEKLNNLRQGIRGSKSGGGMGNFVKFAFSGNGSATSFTLPYAPAAGGMAIWVYYQGQWLQPTTHYSVSGKTLSTTFTPENGTTVEGMLSRS